MLKSLFYREEYRLRENPFSSDAIVKYGSQDIKDNGSIYNPNVRPKTMEEIKNRFIDAGLRGETKFGFLWSLGAIDYTRGFGKTSTMLYLANRINTDFGVSLMREMGYEENEIRKKRAAAAYSSFSATKATSFNWVLFQAIQYMNDNNVLLDMYGALCEKAIHKLGVAFSAADIMSGTCSIDDRLLVEQQVIEEVRAQRVEVKGNTLPFNSGFMVDLLGYMHDSSGTRQFLDSVSEYHRSRSGLLFFDVVVTMLRTAGLNRIFVFLDEIEEFVRLGSRAKLIKEVLRFRDLAIETQPCGDSTVFVVTLHPSAGQVIAPYWREASLPSYDYTQPQNENRVVMLTELEKDQGLALIETYLNHPQFRLGAPPGQNNFHPFTQETASLVWEHSNRHPRRILRNCFSLLDKGAEQNIPIIDAHFIENNLRDIGI